MIFFLCYNKDVYRLFYYTAEKPPTNHLTGQVFMELPNKTQPNLNSEIYSAMLQSRGMSSINRINESSDRDINILRKGYAVLSAELKKQKFFKGILLLKDDNGSVSIDKLQIDDELLQKLGKINKSERNTSTGIKITGLKEESLLAFYQFANNLFKERRFEDSISAYQFLTIVAPDIPSFWLGLGIAYEGNTQWFEAFEALKQSLILEPNEFDPIMIMIRCAQKANDFDPVLRLLEEYRDNPLIKNEIEEALQFIPEIINNKEKL